MYFAVDPCDVRAVCTTLHKEVECHADKYWMALIDGAFDYEGGPPSWARHGIALYGEGGDFRDLHRASPYLVPLDIAAGSLDESFRRFCRHCQGRPMLSFVASALSVDELVHAWRSSLSVRVEGDQNFLLRFADTRSLPTLANVLSPGGWALLTGNLSSWLYIDRLGVLQRLPLAPKNVRADQEITMGGASLSKLLDLSMPDAIIDILVKQVPELLPEKSTSDVYHQAVEVCQFAKQHNVGAMPDIVALMIYRLAAGFDVRYDEALLKVLVSEDYQRGRLIDVLELLVD